MLDSLDMFILKSKSKFQIEPFFGWSHIGKSVFLSGGIINKEKHRAVNKSPGLKCRSSNMAATQWFIIVW